MAIQGQSGVTRSQGGLPVGNGGSLDPGVHYAQKLHDDQFSCGNDYSLKVRKPYTITKQRERWTDEEHKKFLEALKLYGRAWRRIEEHVGTKTAVQIRSHAQKFFSKILRDTNGNNTTLVESIEIPPPRPKRKPVHPYPRKLVEIPKNEMSNLDHPLRSNSLKSLDFGQENKSPKSVLSTVVSETLGSSDSDNTPTGSLSPVSSISAVHTSSFPLVEPKSSSSEEDVSLQPDGLNAGSPHDKQQPLVKLELFSKESVSTKDGEAEESPSRTLKLFGTTLLVTDTCSKPSSPSMEASKPTPAMYDLSTIVPWWSTLSHNTAFMPLYKEDLDEGKNLHSNLVECEDKEVQKEGSCVGSNNTSSMNDVEINERSDDDDQAKSTRVQCYLVGHTTPSETVRPKAKTCGGKGFVPYKRCIAERENQCLDEEREEKRVRLSL